MRKMTKRLLLQAVGVNGKRPERRAGVHLVVTTMIKKMMLKRGRDPATTSESVVHKGMLNRPVPNKHHEVKLNSVFSLYSEFSQSC